MTPVNQFRFYELAMKLHALFACKIQGRAADLFTPLMEAQSALDSLLKGDPVTPDLAKAEANKLLARLSATFNKHFIDPATKQFRAPSGDEKIDSHELAMIATQLEKFEKAWAAELSRASVFQVQKIGIYATDDLLQRAEAMFGDALRDHLPASALEEFRMGGRALALGMGTASVLHLLRAAEQVLQRYYEMVAGAPIAAKTERSWANYLKRLAALAEERADAEAERRVVQLLGQIKERWRNPLLQAEASFSTDEALNLFSLAGSAIGLMAEQMRDLAAHKEARLLAKNSTATVIDRAMIMDPLLDDDNTEIYDFRLPQSIAG